MDEELDFLDLDEFTELEKAGYGRVDYPALVVYKHKSRVNKFLINAKADKFFDRTGYRIRVSENYIIFVPSDRDDPKAFVRQNHKILQSGYTAHAITCPRAIVDVEPGIHRIKKCKYGVCIDRKADK